MPSMPWSGGRGLTCVALLALASLAGCVQRRPGEGGGMMEQAMPWPRDWSAWAGKTVTVEGKALDARMGALLAGDGPEVWIDGRDCWPSGLYLGGDRGKRVRVTGTVIERADLPVFVAEEGELPKAGMPVPPGTDLQQASRRWLLRDARWTVLE